MTQRGRPRHPDILTPREWDVLTLVRQGLSNPEIAERLGVSRDAVKYHVSEILGKLELRSREEAAAWEPERAMAAVMRPAWASALGPLGALLWRLPVIGRAVLMGTAGAAVAGVVGLGVVIGVSELSGDDGSDESAVTEPTDHPTPSPAGSTPEPAVTLNAIPLVLGEATSLPSGWSMVLETGCFQCDGPATGLIRVWRDSAGEPHMDSLFGPVTTLKTYPFESNYTPADVASTDAGLSVGASADGSVLAVARCLEAGCFNVEGPDTEAQSLVYRSLDGGVTWETLAQFDHEVLVQLVLSDGRVLISDQFAGSSTFTSLPDGAEIAPPAPATPVLKPIPLGDGTIGWLGGEGDVYDSNGGVVIDVPGDGVATSALVQVNGYAVVHWSADGGAGEQFISVYAPDLRTTYSTDHLPFDFVALTPEGLLITNVSASSDELRLPAPVGLLPTLVSLVNGEMLAVSDPFTDAAYPADRYIVRALSID